MYCVVVKRRAESTLPDQGFLTCGPHPLKSVCIESRESLISDGKIIFFHTVCNWNLATSPIMNVDNCQLSIAGEWSTASPCLKTTDLFSPWVGNLFALWAILLMNSVGGNTTRWSYSQVWGLVLLNMPNLSFFTRFLGYKRASLNVQTYWLVSHLLMSRQVTWPTPALIWWEAT